MASPGIIKRQKETNREEKQREKLARREQRRKEKGGRDTPDTGEDPDIAGIIPGPQPIPEDFQ